VNSLPGVEVGLGSVRVGVLVGGRGVNVAGTSVCGGGSVGMKVAVSVGAFVAVEVGVSSVACVPLGLGLAEGLAVLVGVGVVWAGGEARDNSGQLQAMVIIAATTAMASTTLLFLYDCDLPSPCGVLSG